MIIFCIIEKIIQKRKIFHSLLKLNKSEIYTYLKIYNSKKIVLIYNKTFYIILIQPIFTL